LHIFNSWLGFRRSLRLGFASLRAGVPRNDPFVGISSKSLFIDYRLLIIGNFVGPCGPPILGGIIPDFGGFFKENPLKQARKRDAVDA